eukprot:gene21602-28602_t
MTDVLAQESKNKKKLQDQEEVLIGIQTISWKPRAFVYHNFLSHQEAAHIISLASPQMKRSTVDSVISAIEQRLAVWSQLPPSHQEDIQVQRYGPTNKFGPHTDGHGRIMSVFMYLVEPEEGGETAFPKSDAWLHKEMSTQQGNLSSCAQGHVAYKPKDSFSQHTGCPVVKGVKWNAVKWIHGAPYRESDWENSLKRKAKAKPTKDPGMCIDYKQQCQYWADERGECQNYPDYMMGSNGGAGYCRKSCKVWRECSGPDDMECYHANREAAGYANYDPEEYGFLKDRVIEEFETTKEELRKKYRRLALIPHHVH